MVLSITKHFNINSQQSVDGGFRAYGSNAPESTVCGLLRGNMTYKTTEERKMAKKESQRKYQKTEHGKEAQRRTYQKNKSKIRLHSKKYRENNKDKIKERKLKFFFGITLEEYEKINNSQNKACAICGFICSVGNYLAVDHCHRTGAIRGLLCNQCNLGIGNFKDDKKLLENAISYLKLIQ